MAVKKAAPAKPAVKAASGKKTPLTAKAVNKKGTKYACSVCGMVVSVETECSCATLCDLVCCEKPMKVTRK